MKKYEVLSRIRKERIVAVIRSENLEQARKGVRALIEGGVRVIEFTFSGRHGNTILEALCAEFADSGVLFGAGTILEGASARIAILAGAEFLVTPVVNEDVMKMGNLYGVPVICGVQTPTEATMALTYGADVVKLFPASGHSPRVIKDWKGPLPNLEIMPTGGIGLDNARSWLEGGAFALGIGGNLVGGIKTGDYDSVRDNAKKYVAIIKEFDSHE